MKKIFIILSTVIFMLSCTMFVMGKDVKPAPNGINIPEGYKDWKSIAVAHRTDNNTLRIILGNDTAVAAARTGKTRPWPEGSIIGKLVWKDTTHKEWPEATIPDKFVHAEFMIKDSAKYKATGGWGFARWKGMDQKPYGDDADFVMECFGCHTPVEDNDYVFTYPANIPE
ncbi:cytochrome P460 family protein [bacterium]|nr:cytochrome P460 family protein [bacterium]